MAAAWQRFESRWHFGGSGAMQTTSEMSSMAGLIKAPTLSRRALPTLGNPVLRQHAQQRAQHAENRIADAITRFAGSMRFVYIHVLWFAIWIGFRVEQYPFGLLTMIVSLESIFLSTFLLISQNRADDKRQVLADEKWATVQAADAQNKEILSLSKQILELTSAVHSMTSSRSGPRRTTRGAA